VAGHSSSALRLPEESQGRRERSSVEGGAWEGMESDSNTSFPMKHSFSASSALMSGATFASWVSRSPYILLKGGGPIEPVLPTHFQLIQTPPLGNPFQICHNTGRYTVPDGWLCNSALDG